MDSGNWASSSLRVYHRTVISEATDINILPSQAFSSLFVRRFVFESCDQLNQFVIIGTGVHSTIY